MQARHAKEYTELVYLQQLKIKWDDSEAAEEYLDLVKDIYQKDGDTNFTKAANALTGVLGKYRQQDRQRSDKLRIEDIAKFTKTDEQWSTYIRQPHKQNIRNKLKKLNKKIQDQV